jgi:integrase
MSSLKDYIKEKRPTLSKSSITTYASILKNLYLKVFGAGDIDFKKYDDYEKVIKFLNDIPPNKRKTILSALVIITDKKQYRDLMLSDVRDYNKEIDKQEKTPEQKESWVDSEQVNDIFKSLKENADLLYKKKKLNINDLQEIQSYIIIALLGGVFIPPRRSKDFVDFKIKNITENDNFLDGKTMVFNSYKTSKTYGQQVIPIDNILLKILKKWIAINPTDYLLFDAHLNPLSSVKLNQRLNKIFSSKKVGVNQLRHTYLTNKFGDTINKKNEIKETMADMGSSSGMLETYVKK